MIKTNFVKKKNLNLNLNRRENILDARFEIRLSKKSAVDFFKICKLLNKNPGSLTRGFIEVYTYSNDEQREKIMEIFHNFDNIVEKEYSGDILKIPTKKNAIFSSRK